MISRTLPLSLLVAVALAVPATALTPPGAGAVAFPPTVNLSWPFPAGEAVHILSGYGPSAGSSLHRDRNAPAKANDHFALDLTLEEHPNHGRGQPVVAPVSGTVLKAGWATSGWANYGQRIILEHDDAGDGHRYTSVYAHLERIDVVEGQHVNKGEPLGALGQSCMGALSCGSFSTPHLHWVIHRDAQIGGSGTGGAYGGNAVVPEVIDGAEDLQRGQLHISLNVGGGAPARPTPCGALIPAGGATVDEAGPCFTKSGTPRFWHDEPTGREGHHLWTETFVGSTPDNTGRWRLFVDAAGDYDLYAAIPAGATAKSAKYQVRTAGGVVDVVRDQTSAVGGWLPLGTFRLVPEVAASITLVDTVSSSSNAGKRLVFDAVHVAPRGVAPPGVPPPPAPPPARGPCDVAGAELVLEENGACAVAAGPTQYWHHESSGSGGHQQWTYAVSQATPDNSVTWSFTTSTAMQVELLVRIPALATSQRTKYRVTVDGVAVDVPLDQRAHAGQLVSLGVFDVDAAGSVLLADNTGEPYTNATTSKKIGFDALVVRPIFDGGGAGSGPADPSGDVLDDDGGDIQGGDVLDGGDATDKEQAADVSIDGEVDVDPFGDTPASGDLDPPVVDGGCAASGASPAWSVLALVVLAGVRRRRR